MMLIEEVREWLRSNHLSTVRVESDGGCYLFFHRFAGKSENEHGWDYYRKGLFALNRSETTPDMLWEHFKNFYEDLMNGRWNDGN